MKAEAQISFRKHDQGGENGKTGDFTKGPRMGGKMSPSYEGGCQIDEV